MLRLCLLLLLAVLLPIRGAAAAAMMCPPAAPVSHHETASHCDPVATPAPSHHSHDGTDKCSLCADCCTAAVPFGYLPGAHAPTAFTAVAFATPRALAPVFISDGLERPPRSC